MARVQVSVVAVLTCLAALILPAAANHHTIERRIASELHEWGNAEREARGIRPLERDPRLDAFADQWARRMARTGAFGHRSDLDGIIDLGYRSAGENIGSIAGDERNAIDIHDGWWRSDEHRRNVLEERFVAVGYGIACAIRLGGLHVFAVANFGGDRTASGQRPIPPEEPRVVDHLGTSVFGCFAALDAEPTPRPTRTASPSPPPQAPLPTATSTGDPLMVIVEPDDTEPVSTSGDRTRWMIAGLMAVAVTIGGVAVRRIRGGQGG